MDKITKASKDHVMVNESLTIFKNGLQALSHKKPLDRLNKLNIFFQKNAVPHFDFEEKEIFPTILKIGEKEDKHLIRNLQQEHITILDQFDQFNDSISNLKLRIDEKEIQKLIETGKKIIKMILGHAREEDRKVFPSLEKYKIELV